MTFCNYFALSEVHIFKYLLFHIPYGALLTIRWNRELVNYCHLKFFAMKLFMPLKICNLYAHTPCEKLVLYLKVFSECFITTSWQYFVDQSPINFKNIPFIVKFLVSRLSVHLLYFLLQIWFQKCFVILVNKLCNQNVCW